MFAHLAIQSFTGCVVIYNKYIHVAILVHIQNMSWSLFFPLVLPSFSPHQPQIPSHFDKLYGKQEGRSHCMLKWAQEIEIHNREEKCNIAKRKTLPQAMQNSWPSCVRSVPTLIHFCFSEKSFLHLSLLK